ncbi:hypothetical protein D5F01_LYC11113 [Larimichthys crocea]|uniref:Uncharacterized protein n=1 Tax=Larimichthys crocea TaxID=215358 RepID=A0A6G0IJ14_LARCR|nr:hypothetical protein D5F01_LYC11113 [Larimichthys crocea]
MDETLALNASDSDLLEEISNTPEVSETSPSPVVPARQPPRLRSVVQAQGENLPPSPVKHRQLQTTGGNATRQFPPGNTPSTLQSQAKATLFHHLQNFLHNSTSHEHHFRVAVAIATTMTSHHRLRLSPPRLSPPRLSTLLQPLPRASYPSSRLLLPPPLLSPPPSNHSLAKATPPTRPTAFPRPSPVSSALRQQILSGNYVDLAQLIHPSTCNPHIPRELQIALGTFQLKQPLTTHSKDRQLVNYLIQGFTHDFHPGLHAIPDSSFSCHNLQSTLSDTVDRLPAKEVKETFMIGPFSSPPFPSFRISPIAIRKYSGKKRLIIPPSFPPSHGLTTMVLAFTNLGVPLSAEKTERPSNFSASPSTLSPYKRPCLSRKSIAPHY